MVLLNHTGQLELCPLQHSDAGVLSCQGKSFYICNQSHSRKASRPTKLSLASSPKQAAQIIAGKMIRWTVTL